MKRTDWRIDFIFRFVDVAIFSSIHGTIVLRLLLNSLLSLFEAVGVVILRRGPLVRFIEMRVGDGLRRWCDLRVSFVHDILEGGESVVDEVKMQRD